MDIVITPNYIAYVTNGKVTLAKSNTTGKFVKLVLAQAEYDMINNKTINLNFTMLVIASVILLIGTIVNNDIVLMFICASVVVTYSVKHIINGYSINSEVSI